MLSNQFLDDIRVLDLSQYIPGPFATRQLADLGADVIKIEPPGGDPMRVFMQAEVDNISPVYRHLNRGKKISELDLKCAKGKEVLFDLLEDADVLLESFRPGVLARLGFDRVTLGKINPRLIHCALSGYGQTGPYRQRAGHDINYNAASGMLAVSGINERPVISFPPLADHAGAMQASITILAALHARQRSNNGAYLDVSLFEASLSWQSLPLLESSISRANWLLNGGAACYNIYPCSDGKFISLGAIEVHFWRRFCKTINRTEWINRQYELMPQHALIDELSALIKQNSRDYWAQRFESEDCCVEAVLMPEEVSNNSQAMSRNSLSQFGPTYPGYINDAAVSLNEAYLLLHETEIPAWEKE